MTATTIITGQDLTLTIATIPYNDQAASVTLTLQNDQQEFEVLTGTAYKTIKRTGTLSIELMQDFGKATGSICEALWNAAKTAPDTTLAFTFVANTGATFTGNVYPAFPDAGGAAADALMATVELVIDEGSVTLA
jgi:hypothetical protein